MVRGRRRGGDAGPVVVIDVEDDGEDAADDSAGGGGGAAAAVKRRVVVPGAVATRTRSRRMAIAQQAPVTPPAAAEEAPSRRRKRKGAASAEAGGGGPSKRRVRSSGSAGGRGARKRKEAEADEEEAEAEAEEEAEAEAGTPARGESMEVSQVDGGGSSGRADDASHNGNGESRVCNADGIDQASEERPSVAGGDLIEEEHCGNGEASVAGGDRIEEHCGNVEASVTNSNRDGGEIIAGEGTEDRGNTELAVVDPVNEELASDEDDYDDEMLEEKLVGDVIRAYSNGADLDTNGVDWEAEDEMEFADLDTNVVDWEAEDEMEFDDDNDNDADDDGDNFGGDADEGDKSVQMHDFSKVETQDLVSHNVNVSEVRPHEDEEAIKDEMESKGKGSLSFNEGSSYIEILDSDEEVKVVNDTGNALRRKPLVPAKLPIVPSCVAWRTRSSWGMKEERISYNTYFEVLSDEPKEDDDDTEVELDDEEDDENDDDCNSASCDEEDEEEEEEREEEEEEAQRRKQKKGIDSSDDEMIDDAVDCGIDWEEDYPEVDFTRPLTFQKDGSEAPVGSEAFTEQQKRSRFTWELERRKKLKLGMMTNHRLYERDLESDSNSSDSSQNRKNGCQGSGDHRTGRKRKNPLSKSGKKSSRMLKRQSLMKLLMDKMCSNDDGKSTPFDQKPQIEYSFKDLHPLVFSFGDDDPSPTDRSEQDAALDMLWADLDFTLESENIGTYYDDEGQEDSLLDHALAPITPCSRGKHEFIIDEQIGIRCKYCSLVNLEIRFILPLLHQREAFEFMWTNLVGDIRLNEIKHGAKPDVVGGCVICHAPGTGKTRLAIVFIQTYMKVFPDCRPVIIAPRGMLFAWEQEFKKWNVNVPFHIMNTTDYSGKEDRDICRLIKKEHRTEKLTRLVKLFSWNRGHGVLGISYGLYMKLTSEKVGCTGENKVRTILLENPGLLVLDEGHTPRNERSVIWKTLGKVKTEKRIILSGTPFQNNFLELYNILCLVRPRFGEMFLTKTRVGRRHCVSKKQRDKFSDKYEKGVWASLTSNVTDDNAEKVRSILKPFVHIHNGTILRTLPGLRECVIVLKPLPLQKSIIRKVENVGSGNNFEHEYVISLASTHPSLVNAINMTEEEASLIDKPMLERLRSNPYEGVKTRFVMEVVRLCEALKEKVLIFSQFIQPLELIKEHLRKIFKWREGKEILQMDGKILPRYRQNSIEVFNNPDSDARVLLASTRACCEGISLTGASRVVLLDVVWNPAVGRQAISRAFRIGQKKFVYTYNLITYGTGEGDKYDRQAEKDHLSKLVFSTEDEFSNVRNMLSKAEMEHCSKLISEDKVLEEMTSHDQLKGMFLKIHYPPTESNIVFTYNQIAPELS
ncbi:hypothetical protein OsI_19844 [Oryza sativa Indica Group]|uniref:Uncharacterized protein n=1 Tax=Oryza sativa subsp. indica TaxID=39946 RepID=A2Y4B8_ORYSI|nr:hypothetical protein OsI_19844 [Oryza sativa Indica Group]